MKRCTRAPKHRLLTPVRTAPLCMPAAKSYVVRPAFGTLANVAKVPPRLWREAEELASSIQAAQEAFALSDDKAAFDNTIASGKEFAKMLATERKLRKQTHNKRQGSVETRLDRIYAVMRFTAQIAAAEV